MRQYELAIRIAQVHHLVDERKYKKALAVIQTLDMRQVRSLSDLKVFAEVYTRTEQFDAAKATYLRIYRRSQTRRVLHRLIYLSIRTNALDEAEMYYQEFVRTNPNERDALIMRYRIDKARGVPIGRLIEILQDLKQEEYIEEWAYELAKLYHRAGRREECIAECEDILLWFGTGEIVERAKILIDHLEERDPIPYYDDKDFTEPRKEEPNPDDTGSLPDLNEFIKKRKAQRKSERLAESIARREEGSHVRQEEKKAAREKGEPNPVPDKENLPKTDEELEKEIDRQLESCDEDEIDRELSLKAAKKAQAERSEEDGAIKKDAADTAPEEFIDDYQEDESFGENMDLPKKAMDGIQKLLKFGKKEEDREKAKDKEELERKSEKEEPDKEEEKPRTAVASANKGGEREYVPHSQSGTGITQDLAREISAIYEMEHKEQLQEKGVTVINDAPSNIATDLVERMNQALNHAPKRYIPLDVEEIRGQDSGVMEADTKDLSKDTDAWVDEAITKDLSRHSAALNGQEKKEVRHKPSFRREVSEKNSAKDARERLKNIVENRREKREDIAGEEERLKRDGLAQGQPPQKLSGENSADAAVEAAYDAEEQPGMEELSGENLADVAVEAADGVQEKSGVEELSGENLADAAVEAAYDAEGQPGMEELSDKYSADTLAEATDGMEEQPEVKELSGKPSIETMTDNTDSSEDETELLRQLLEGEVEEPDELLELSEEEMEPSDGREALEELLEDVAEPSVLVTGVREYSEPGDFGGTVFHSVEPQFSSVEPEVEVEGKVDKELSVDAREESVQQEVAEEPEEGRNSGESVFHSVEPQSRDLDLEEQLKAELEEFERELGKEALYEGEERTEQQAGGSQEHGFAQELKKAGEESEYGQVPELAQEEPEYGREPVGGEPEYSQRLEAGEYEPEYSQKSEAIRGESEYSPEPEAAEYKSEYSQEPEAAKYDLEYSQKPEAREYEPEYSQEPEAAKYEPEYSPKAEAGEYEPEYSQKSEATGVEPEYSPEPEAGEYEPEYSQEPETAKYEPEYSQKPEAGEYEPEYSQEPEAGEYEPEYSPKAEAGEYEPEYSPESEAAEDKPEYSREAAPAASGSEYGQKPEQGRGQHERARRQQEAIREQDEEPVNRLSREMAAYHAPEIPVVETEYMEMPEITYDDLPTTRALQESFDYVLQLIEGELEPSHFVLMGDGTERIVGVAKRIVRVMKNSGFISRGRIAKIHAKQLNKMDLISFRSQLFGNCLLIDGAADLLFPTITRIFSIMEEYKGNFVVILADEGTTLDQLFRFVPALAKRFQYIIDISKYTSEDYE